MLRSRSQLEPVLVPNFESGSARNPGPPKKRQNTEQNIESLANLKQIIFLFLCNIWQV